MKERENKLKKVLEIASKRGFFWPTAEIYPDKQAGFFDYGQNGIALKENIIKIWRKELVRKEEMIEIDGSQIMPKSVFIASGHLTNFTDPLVSCQKCGSKFKANRLIEEVTKKEIPEKLSNEKYDELIKKYKIKCPKCGSNLKKTEQWNMMLRTGIGAELKECYLRPETCQSIFINFPRIFRTARVKLPFAIAQIGKVFRNEISPRQGLVRLREITQMEIEVFFNPERENEMDIKQVKTEILPLYIEGKLIKMGVENAVKEKKISSKLIAYYLALLKKFYGEVGIKNEFMRFRLVSKDDRPFYAKETWDFEVLTSIGWLELCACNHRGNYDLSRHQQVSKQNFEVVDENTGKKVLPNVFELSAGLDRTIFALLDTSYKEEPKNDRTTFTFSPKIAPVKIAILPLVNKEGMPEIAKKIYEGLRKDFSCFYDDSGSIGRRYRRQDEIGTPFCITIDSQTLKDDTVTIRDRDTMKQTRIKIDKLDKFLKTQI
ncbi:MAG: glycine--tRNA ligase [Candidatus Pacearchaeota archaeon]